MTYQNHNILQKKYRGNILKKYKTNWEEENKNKEEKNDGEDEENEEDGGEEDYYQRILGLTCAIYICIIWIHTNKIRIESSEIHIAIKKNHCVI